MTRRRIIVDLCTLTQDTTNNATPHCNRKATLTVEGHRVCRYHVATAIEIETGNGNGNPTVSADYEADGGYTTEADPDGVA